MIAVVILIVLVTFLSAYSAVGTCHNQQDIKDLTDVTKGIVINANHIYQIFEMLKEQELKQTARKHKPVYICDPAKNTSCTKEWCMIFHFCRCTTNKEFAKTGENGKPIVAVRSDM